MHALMTIFDQDMGRTSLMHGTPPIFVGLIFDIFNFWWPSIGHGHGGIPTSHS